MGRMVMVGISDSSCSTWERSSMMSEVREDSSSMVSPASLSSSMASPAFSSNSRSLRTALPPLSTLRANARSAEDKLSLAACISCLAASNSSILMEGTTNFSAAAAISCADSFARSRLVRMAASSTWSVSTTVWADSIPANAARASSASAAASSAAAMAAFSSSNFICRSRSASDAPKSFRMFSTSSCVSVSCWDASCNFW